MTQATYIKIDDAHQEMNRDNDAALWDEISEFTDNARINADDTIYGDKSRPEADWDAVFVDSIIGGLSFNAPSEAAIAWFASQGVKA